MWCVLCLFVVWVPANVVCVVFVGTACVYIQACMSVYP